MHRRRRWAHSTQFRHLTEMQELGILDTLNSIVNGERHKPPEGNAAPKWEELCSGGHCLSIFTAERALGKAAVLLGTSVRLD